MAGMSQSKSSAAWPVGLLFGVIVALLFVTISHEVPDWVYFMIFFCWWVGFHIWYKHFYRR